MTPFMRWMVPIICLMIIWFSIFALLYLKADEVTKHPCQVCANKMGKAVVCNQIEIKNGLIPASKTFYPPTLNNSGLNDSKFNFTLPDG